MNRDEKYDSKKTTIAEVLSSCRLPEVVRICASENDQEHIGCRYYSRIDPNTELLLQNTQRVKYAHIKVLKFYDNNKAQKEKGPEYVLEHETYVGEEFLIPVKYKGKVKFGRRPGSWRRYATISQVLEALPRYIKVGEDTEALDAKNLDAKVKIPAKSTLELVREFQNPKDGVCYLECKAGNTSYAFRDHGIVNFTEVEDTKLYNLFELVRFKMLPKVILFEKIEVEDAILVDKEFNSALLTSVEGPLELLGFVDIEHLVCWVRDKEKKVYRTVLIPKGAWNTILAQRRSFIAKDERDSYVARKFRHCYSSDFIDKYLYWIPLDQTLVTWIRNPEYYAAPRNDMELYSHLPMEFPESSDDEEERGDYEVIPEPPVPPPPIPPHIPISVERGDHEEPAEQSVWKKILHKRALFKDVHKELKKFFHKRLPSKDNKDEQQDRPPNRPPKPAAIQRSFSERLPANPSFQRPGIQRPINRSSSIDETYNHSDSEDTETDASRRNYDYPDLNRMTPFFEASLRRQENVNAERPLPPIPDEVFEENKDVPKKPGYAFLNAGDAAHLFQKNLTEADFCKYSVVEVEHCFRVCGLADFGKKCLEQTLDGKFFKNIDLHILKEEPFNLTEFQMLKVKKIVCDGWRPNIYAETCEYEIKL